MWISRKDYLDLKAGISNLMQQLEAFKTRPYLISIDRQGRENVFTFSRGTETYQVRTMGLLSDNLPEWKEKLIR